jgi:V/A-type H+-transporting ATPase subunit I
MIVKMDKYSFVVVASGRDGFLERLQELGMVDVTVSSWEPTEDERTLVGLIERHRAAAEFLRAMEKKTVEGKTEAADVKDAPDALRNDVAAKPFASGAEAFTEYERARQGIAAAEGEIARYGKLLDEAAPLGEFDPAWIRELEGHGVAIASLLEAAGLDPEQEIRLPDESPAAMRGHVAELNREIKGHERTLARAAATVEGIEAEGGRLSDKLQFSRTKRSGSEEAEGSLVVMEAWARRRDAAAVERMLEQNPGVFHIKERPTPDDETPVELHNSRVARPFEFIGNLYGMPRYGTMDLTRWFAPFYTFFFAFCLGDAGYGAVIFGLGLYLALKGSGAMKSIGTLCMWLGGTSMAFGFLCGSLFGIVLPSMPLFANYKDIFLDADNLFNLAIITGVVQILFGMVLKAVTLARSYGFRYALSTIGWIMTLAMTLPTLLGMFGMTVPAFPKQVMYGCLGMGGFLMLFMNNPGKNPLVNFGGGLWNLYNDVTGFLSDFLSYIRLFAIGMSGGILAQVFNSLAMDMSGDIPGVKQLVATVILLIGHGLTLFMSTLSSVVHPLRLTFVEFYKNAGFESSARVFAPLKRTEQ